MPFFGLYFLYGNRWNWKVHMGPLYPVKFSPAFPIISRRNFDFSDYVLFVTWNGSLVRFVNITNYTSLRVM